MAVRGFLSSCSLYAAHPGTAPPRTAVGSRKRAEDSAAPGSFLRRVGTRAGLARGEVAERDLMALVCLTPKAEAARNIEERRMELKSFIFASGGVGDEVWMGRMPMDEEY